MGEVYSMCDCAARLDELQARLDELVPRVAALEAVDHTAQHIESTKKKRVMLASADEFARFWVCYPKKVGKKAAQKAFQNAQNRPRIDDLLKAIDRARVSEQWRKDGGQFIPNPATWLNQGRWDDEPVQVVPVQPKAQVKVYSAPLSSEARTKAYEPPPPEVMALLNRIGKGM